MAQLIQVFDIDTDIYSVNPTTNYGTESGLNIELTSSDGKGYDIARNILAKVDFSAATDITSTNVTSATLNMKVASLVGFSLNAYFAKCMRTTGANAWVETEATWNVYKNGTGIPWGLVGCSLDPDDYDDSIRSDTVDVITHGSGWTDWDIWAGGDPASSLIYDAIVNCGKVLNVVSKAGSTNLGINNASFWSSEAIYPTNRPYIEINYTVAGVAKTYVMMF